ncbi:MAG: flippase-like domain-containing protein [Candidatus Aminicenantes bacterium]|nr:flippase-like domain-containing protein [Candidatus Aminicenantes bacterium]
MNFQKKYLKSALKFVISFSILAYLLFFKVPVAGILAHIKNAVFIWILLSFSLHAIGLLISAVRWKILIQAQGDSVPLAYLAQSYLVGTFFNNFLPTRFGGDAVRIWDGSRYSRSLLGSTAVVLIERLTGIIILLFFSLAASLLRLDMARRVPVIWVSLAVGLFGLACIGLFFLPPGEKLLSLLPEKGWMAKLRLKINEFRKTGLVYKEKKAAFLKALFWAFLLQVNVIVHYYLVGIALGLAIPFSDYFIFIPIVLIILTIPITLGGHGARELLYVQIFSFYAVSGSAALAFSAIADVAFTLIIGIIGGIIFFLRK